MIVKHILEIILVIISLKLDLKANVFIEKKKQYLFYIKIKEKMVIKL